MNNWLETTGTLISKIGKDGFPRSLSLALKGIAEVDFTVMFGYLGSAQPLDLYDDFPEGKHKVFVEDYQEGPYLLDPFYLASLDQVDPGLYRLKDIAPDRFYQGEYFRNYYKQTGLAEEIGYFVNLPSGAIVVVSLMRTKKAFSAKEVRELRQYWPIVNAACCQHWGELASNFNDAKGLNPVNKMHTSIERTFQLLGKGALTPREKEVVEFTLKGHSADAVGRILSISPGTVRIHRRNIYSKLRIHSQGELFSIFINTLVDESDQDRTSGKLGQST